MPALLHGCQCFVPFRSASCSRTVAPQCACAHARPSSAATSSAGLVRRDILLQGLLASAATLASDAFRPRPSSALGFKKELKKRKVPEEEYTAIGDGLKVYDITLGSGEEVVKGTKVKVHYDCVYKGLDVVSSRQARLLGGNRTISEPFEFVAGAAVAGASPTRFVDSAGGLFSGQGGPVPPPALSASVIGMRAGGKLGYGNKGVGEIPPGASFEMRVEVLNVG